MLQIATPSAESVIAISPPIFDRQIVFRSTTPSLVQRETAPMLTLIVCIYTLLLISYSHHSYPEIVQKQIGQKKSERQKKVNEASHVVSGLFGGRVLVSGSMVMKSRLADSEQLMEGLDTVFYDQLEKRGVGGCFLAQFFRLAAEEF